MSIVALNVQYYTRMKYHSIPQHNSKILYTIVCHDCQILLYVIKKSSVIGQADATIEHVVAKLQLFNSIGAKSIDYLSTILDWSVTNL